MSNNKETCIDLTQSPSYEKEYEINDETPSSYEEEIYSEDETYSDEFSEEDSSIEVKVKVYKS